MSKPYLFTSESVTEGHPDKLCDLISDALLDEYIRRDAGSRVAIETLATTDYAVVAGEVSSNADFGRDAQEEVVRRTIRGVGYDDPALRFDAASCGVDLRIHAQSPDISRGLGGGGPGGRGQGAGDQGLMFGYATGETEQRMPLPIQLAHSLTRRLADERKSGGLPWARPDGKAQVSVRYEDDRPVSVETVVVSTQHAPEASNDSIRSDVIERVVKPACGELWSDGITVHINPTGRFEIGGPHGDTGLTGRKIIVDTYGGFGRHGGGAFSGKDPSKVDRSACYMCRYVAKNIVASGLARRCEVQVAYAIGVTEPVSLMVDAFGTETIPEERIEEIVRGQFDMTPAGIIEHLDLKRPVYSETAAYGHFGRDGFSWERTDKAGALGEAAGR